MCLAQFFWVTYPLQACEKFIWLATSQWKIQHVQKERNLFFLPAAFITQSSMQSSCIHQPHAHSTQSLPDFCSTSSWYAPKQTLHMSLNSSCIRSLFVDVAILSLLLFSPLFSSGAPLVVGFTLFWALGSVFCDLSLAFSLAAPAFSSAFHVLASTFLVSLSGPFFCSSFFSFFSSLSFFRLSFSSASNLFSPLIP